MSVENFIRAMPKVELYLQLEGAMHLDTLRMIAEQNEIPDTIKRFGDWVELLNNPDFERIEEITRNVSQWLQQPEDLTRIVYDMGVALSKQNVRYAEVCINPMLYMQDGITFEDVLEAIKDGCDRAARGWGVQIAWILTIPREEPRKSDEIVRWTAGATAKKAGVVALGLTGREDLQPVGQFERAFRMAEKKNLFRVCQAGDPLGAEGVLDALNVLGPDRIMDGWGAADAPDVLKSLVDGDIPLHVSMAKALCMEWVPSYGDYPLHHLYEADVKLVLGSGMPSLFKSHLSDEYLAAVEHGHLTLDELEDIALNAVRYSFLPAEEKEAMLAEFTKAYAELRAEHITPEETT